MSDYECTKCGFKNGYHGLGCPMSDYVKPKPPSENPMYPSKVKLFKWVQPLALYDKTPMYPPVIVVPGALVKFSGNTCVNFIPDELAVSCNPKSRLNIELRIASQCFQLGNTDLWPRDSNQKDTAFRISLIGISTVSPSNQMMVHCTNHGKYKAFPYFQVSGMAGMP